MISDLDTIVQLFAAIYTTLAIDIQFFQRFWSQAYYHTVTQIVKEYGFCNSSKHQNAFEIHIKENADLLEKNSRKRGVFMFLFCLILLIYSAFEESEDYLHISFFSIFSLLIVPFCHYLLKKWNYIILLLLVLLFILIIPYQTSLEGYIPIIKNLSNVTFTKTIIIVTLIYPITWQLFSNWLYSIIYQKYLVEILNKEADDYQAAFKAISSGKRELLPDTYESTIVSIHFQDDNSADMPITELNKTLDNRLKEACKQPHFMTLIRYIRKKANEIKPIKDDDLLVKDINNSVVTEIPIPNSNENETHPNISTTIHSHNPKNYRPRKMQRKKR